MGKFDKVKSNAANIAKVEAVKAEKKAVENILIENLIPDPNNNEDISITSDLEKSISKVGFIEPITVTAFGCESGKYRIVSGHRRTEAMRKLGKLSIPAFIENFKTEEEVAMARMMANLATRDSAKNPKLYIQRAKTWSDALGGTMKKGELIKSFAEGSGMSEKQAERYFSLTKVNDHILDMVVREEVGMSSVLPCATLSDEEQECVYEIFQSALQDKIQLSRDNCKDIVVKFKDGVVEWSSIKESLFDTPIAKENLVPVLTVRNETVNEIEENTEDEAEEKDTVGNSSTETSESKEIKKRKNGKDILKTVGKLESLLSELYEFADDEEGNVAIRSLMELSKMIITECDSISGEYENGYDTYMTSKHNLKEEFFK